MQGFYPKILKQAFSLAKDHRIFWVAGLFLVWPNFARTILWLLAIMALLNIDQSYTETGGAVQQGNIWMGLFVIFAIGMFVTYYYRSRAVVGVATKHLKDHGQVENPKIYQEADPYTWELMKFGFTASVGIVMLVAFLSSPVMYLSANGFSSRALILGLFGFGVFLPVFTVLYYSMIFVPMFVVVHKMSSTSGFKVAFELVKRNWIYLTFASFLLLGIEFLAVLAGLFILYLVSLGVVILAQIFYNMGGSGAIDALQVLFATLGFMVFFISQSAIAVFQRIVWAIMFFEIVKPVKTEEPVAAETVPEVIPQ